MQVSTADFKKGLRIVFDGQPYAIVDFQHVKPGKGGAFVRTKLKHMRLGKVIDNTFRSGEKVELVEYDEKHMQFLYKDERYHFMDTETYEQVSRSATPASTSRRTPRWTSSISTAPRRPWSCRTSSSWRSRGPIPACAETPRRAGRSLPRSRPAPASRSRSSSTKAMSSKSIRGPASISAASRRPVDGPARRRTRVVRRRRPARRADAAAGRDRRR